MNDEFTSRLDVLARTLGRHKFSPTNSRADDFSFDVSRKGHDLIFKHDNIWVKVGDFELIDLAEWAKLPAMETGGYRAANTSVGIRNFYYFVAVEWQVGDLKNKGKVALGYHLYRDRVLKGLGNRIERERIDDLLLLIEKVAAGLFHTGLVMKQPFTPRPEQPDRMVSPFKF